MIDDRLIYHVTRDGEHFCIAVAVQISRFPEEHEEYGGQLGLRFANANWGDNIVPGEFVKETPNGFVWRHPRWGELDFEALNDEQWRDVLKRYIVYAEGIPDTAQEAAEWYRRRCTRGGLLRGRQDRYGNPIED